jgi:hypothetical protein
VVFVNKSTFDKQVETLYLRELMYDTKRSFFQWAQRDASEFLEEMGWKSASHCALDKCWKYLCSRKVLVHIDSIDTSKLPYTLQKLFLRVEQRRHRYHHIDEFDIPVVMLVAMTRDLLAMRQVLEDIAGVRDVSYFNFWTFLRELSNRTFLD